MGLFVSNLSIKLVSECVFYYNSGSVLTRFVSRNASSIECDTAEEMRNRITSVFLYLNVISVEDPTFLDRVHKSTIRLAINSLPIGLTTVYGSFSLVVNPVVIQQTRRPENLLYETIGYSRTRPKDQYSYK